MPLHPEVLYDVSGMECVPLGTKQQEVMLENDAINDFRLPSGQDLNGSCNNISGWCATLPSIMAYNLYNYCYTF